MAMQSYGAAGQMLMGPPPTNMIAKGAQELAAIKKLPEKKVSVPALLCTILVPWLIFTVVLYVRGLWLHYFYPMLSLGLALYFLIFVLVAGVMAFGAARDPQKGDVRMLGLTSFLCTIAWVTAWCAGDKIFTSYTAAYYDVTNLNTYPSVDPVKFSGIRLMDAGIIEFAEEAKLDLTKTVGFKDGDVYCAAPITMPGNTEKHFDFWAVGINCCSSIKGSPASFRCGEYNIPGIHKGLRLMNDAQRPFFRLAVKEAEAAYNIEARHPVFLNWMADPEGEAEAYQDDAFRYFTFGVFSFFGVLVFIAVSAGIVLHLSVK